MVERTSSERSLRLYNGIAPYYDFLHGLQTLWADNIHRRRAVEMVNLKKDDSVLDVGTGTGLTAIEAFKVNPYIELVGVDRSPRMLERARKRLSGTVAAGHFRLVENELEGLSGIENNYFDAIISAYGFGGVNDTGKAMRELVRVAKPGARISMAEMGMPVQDGLADVVRGAVHKLVVEPWIRWAWEFRDLNLRDLYIRNGISLTGLEYHTERLLGSTMVASGIVNK